MLLIRPNYQVFSCGNHAEQSIMVFQHMYIKKVQGWKWPLTVLTAVTMYAVVVSFVPMRTSNEGSKESHQNKKGNKQINGGGC